MNHRPPRLRTALSQGAGVDLLELSARYLEEYLDKIDHCLATLDDEQIWWRPNPESNSIGNLVLHLEGNLTQWLLSGLGGQAFTRHRSEEFRADRTRTGAELRRALPPVVEGCRAVLEGLTEAELAVEHDIQGYRIDGLGIVVHAVEHMSYHTGQIVAFAKLLEGGGAIDFYPQHAAE
ncbi:MAG: DUF1572 family protein [Acidobacteria bacterium]|nr:DUF1572 family protein [Acidobacteriota bacterium]